MKEASKGVRGLQDWDLGHEFLTPITVDVTVEGAKPKRRPIIALSDAAYHEEVDEATGETRRICAVNVDVFDLETMRLHSTHGVIPESYYKKWIKKG